MPFHIISSIYLAPRGLTAGDILISQSNTSSSKNIRQNKAGSSRQVMEVSKHFSHTCFSHSLICCVSRMTYEHLHIEHLRQTLECSHSEKKKKMKKNLSFCEGELKHHITSLLINYCLQLLCCFTELHLSATNSAQPLEKYNYYFLINQWFVFHVNIKDLKSICLDLFVWFFCF